MLIVRKYCENSIPTLYVTLIDIQLNKLVIIIITDCLVLLDQLFLPVGKCPPLIAAHIRFVSVDIRYYFLENI